MDENKADQYIKVTPLRDYVVMENELKTLRLRNAKLEAFVESVVTYPKMVSSSFADDLYALSKEARALLAEIKKPSSTNEVNEG